MRLRPVPLLAAAALLAGCGGREDSQTAATARTSPVLLIGIDGATWDLVHPLILRGKLPNLERLRRNGASGRLVSFEPISSPAIWTTIATGRSPQDHGILKFQKDGVRGRAAFYTNADRRCRAVWNILTERGRLSNVVGWFNSWPADRTLGAFVSDRTEEPVEAGQDPPDLEPLLLRSARDLPLEEARRQAESFLGPPLDPARSPSEDPRWYRHVEEELARHYRVDRLRLAWALDLLGTRPADLTAVYFRGTDALSHLAWHFMDPSAFPPGVRPDAEAASRYGPMITRYYEFLDEAVGALLSAAPLHTDLILVSDHGFGPASDHSGEAFYELNPLLERLGWGRPSGPPGSDPPGPLVVDPTPLWAGHRTERPLWVNVALLDAVPRGTDRGPRSVQEIAGRLREVSTSAGARLFREVRPAEDGRRLDVRINTAAVGWTEEGGRTHARGTYRVGERHHPLSELARRRIARSGTHRLEGVLLLAGPRIRRGAVVEGASVYDVAPTLLRLLGLPRARNMPGRVLEEAVVETLVPDPGPSIATYETDDPIPRHELPEESREEEERERLDRLGALGYVR